jgi:hypothetical protein
MLLVSADFHLTRLPHFLAANHGAASTVICHLKHSYQDLAVSALPLPLAFRLWPPAAHCCWPRALSKGPRCFNFASCGFSISLIKASYPSFPSSSSMILIRACMASRCQNKSLYSRLMESYVACAVVLGDGGVDKNLPVRSAMLVQSQLALMFQ